MNALLDRTSAQVAPPETPPETETAAVRAKSVIPELDGVRAIACLLVIWLHINLITRDMHIWSPGTTPPLIDVLLFSGSIGVTLFFVLSGFLLFLPYVQALLAVPGTPGARPWPSARQFYLRRAWRILPGYYAALFLLVLLQQPQYLSPSHWRDLALFLVLFMDSIPATFQQLNGPFWTLAIEWQFYLLLPFLALGVRALVGRLPRSRRGGRSGQGWGIAGCLVVLLGWGVLSHYVGAWLVAHPAATVPLVPRRVLDVVVFFLYGVRGKYLEDFACGMLASLCYTVLRDPTHANALRRLQRISPWVGGGVAGVALAGMALATHGALFASSGVSGLSGLGAALASSDELALSLGFASGILAILFGGSRVRRVFASVPLRWIGLISYSLYIWHLLLLVVFMHQLGPSLFVLPAIVAYALYWAWVGVVVIPFAAGVYWLVEQPGIRMGERMPRALFAGRRRISSTATLDRESITATEREGPHKSEGAKYDPTL
jgi:peptidoglycan/LPS O-acetylase OafA/YrhL